MATTNKDLAQPTFNSTNWDVPLNSNTGIIDDALGGNIGKNVTGVSTTPVVLTTSEYQKLILTFSGTLTNNVTYNIPSGVGGQWVVRNATTGAFSVTIGVVGGSLSVVVPQGSQRTVYSDGSDVRFSNEQTTASTAAVGTNTTQIATTAFVNAEIANDAPAKDGTGATGTWGINISGNAATVTSLSAAQVGTATAGLAWGDVGTYAFFSHLTSTSYLPGATIAGSSLRSAGLQNSSTNPQVSGNPTPTGTWRVMGIMSYGSQGPIQGSTVCLRIA